jgi:hypothetical protein
VAEDAPAAPLTPEPEPGAPFENAEGGAVFHAPGPSPAEEGGSRSEAFVATVA